MKNKKFLIFSILILFCIFIPTAYAKSKAMILFNNAPITKETLLHNANQFITGKKIYYIFISEKPLKTDSLRVRVLKKDGKGETFVPVKLVYSNDFRLNKDQVYYYNDYIIINESGDYCMAVYAINALNRPIITADFRVKN